MALEGEKRSQFKENRREEKKRMKGSLTRKHWSGESDIDGESRFSMKSSRTKGFWG